VPKY